MTNPSTPGARRDQTGTHGVGVHEGFRGSGRVGRLTFLGRDDEIFKRRGGRTSTTKIEAAALDVPGVTQAAVNPPGADGVLHIWVVSRGSGADVLRGLSERLDPAKVPDQCWVQDRLLQTPHRRVDRQRLRQAERNVPGQVADVAETTTGTTTGTTT